jgi:hypothetical protein
VSQLQPPRSYVNCPSCGRSIPAAFVELHVQSCLLLGACRRDSPVTASREQSQPQLQRQQASLLSDSRKDTDAMHTDLENDAARALGCGGHDVGCKGIRNEAARCNWGILPPTTTCSSQKEGESLPASAESAQHSGPAIRQAPARQGAVQQHQCNAYKALMQVRLLLQRLIPTTVAGNVG